MKFILQLDDEDKQTILLLIVKMLTNKKFKDFFQKNVATLYSKKPDKSGLFLLHSYNYKQQ